MTKNLYLKKVFANNAIFSKIMSQSKDFFWLFQAPNISKHISRNGEATIKASPKTGHDKVFFILGQKGNLFPKNGGTIKKRYSPKYVYWYQCFNVWKMVGAKSPVHGRPAQRFRHSIESHCLCMWVKNMHLWCQNPSAQQRYRCWDPPCKVTTWCMQFLRSYHLQQATWPWASLKVQNGHKGPYWTVPRVLFGEHPCKVTQ